MVKLMSRLSLLVEDIELTDVPYLKDDFFIIY